MSIQLFTPTFHVDECLQEIRECLEVGWTGLGFKTVQFERAWKEFTGLPHAYFVNSATAGLNLGVEILKRGYGWEDEDEVITTPLTFVSTNHAILLNGLRPVFADVDEYLCLDPEDVKQKITPKTKAVMYVGMGGNTGRYNQIVDICEQHNLKLILDAAHMAGTRLNGKIPGQDADVVIYSFQAVKNLPTADAGMVCFREPQFDEKCRKLSWLGINKDTYTRTTSKGSYKWKYDVEDIGYKYHGNSIMAAIALVQLRYLDQDNAYRRQIASWYNEAFSPHSSIINPVPVAHGCESSTHLYVIKVHNRDQLMLALNDVGIYPGVHYVDNTVYGMYSYAHGSCPTAHEVSKRILSLPMHLRLSKKDVDFIAQNVIEYARGK